MENITSRINPRVSVWADERHPKTGEDLTLLDLYSVMKQCERISPDAEKGKSGAVFPYLSDVVNPHTRVFDGVIFVDIDNCSEISHIIFESFDKLCKAMPNLLAMNFSYSANLHCYFYDEEIKKDSSQYSERAILYLSAFAAAVRKILNIDLRNIEGALDDHSKSPYQRLYLNRSRFHWNIHCCKATIKEEELHRLKAEYHSLYRKIETQRTLVDTPMIKGEGKIAIDSNYNLLGYGTGFDARTLIAAAVYFHFKKDIDLARDYLSKTFENAHEINVQMTSMINNGYIAKKYRQDVERFLFGYETGAEQILEPGQYLSDVIDVDVDLDSQNGKYFYIQSNTGSGKTEFVKKIIKSSKGNIFFIQITKALRDGKKQTIEEYTFENWEYGLDESLTKFHLALDGAVKQLMTKSSKLNIYTVIVDESHLLEDYIDIRERAINDLIRLLKRAGRVIFMSATPKSDIDLFPFKKICYSRIQEQDLIIHQHPLKLSGTGSAERAYYEYMTDWVKSRKNKVIVFSNKKQEAWKKYGLACDGVTYFNSKNLKDEGVQAILNENRLINHITLSTLYMGCGVEVKHEKEVDIVFFLNEGFDDSSIIQSIGRPRCSGGVERVNVHFFYSTTCSFKGRYTEKNIEYLQNAFDNLIVDEGNGKLVNVIASHLTGIRSDDFDEWGAKDDIKMLKTAQIARNITYLSPYGSRVLKHLPYRSIDIIDEDVVTLNTSGKKSIVRSEEKLLHYLRSLPIQDVVNLVDEDGYETLLNSGKIPFNDKVNAREEIRRAMFIARQGIEVSEALTFFGSLKKAVKYVVALHIHLSLDLKHEAIKDFVGGEQIKEKLLKELMYVKDIFTEEFIQYKLDKWSGRISESVLDDFWKLKHEDIFLDFLGINKTDLITDSEYKKIPIFKGSSFKDCVSTKKGRALGGTIGSKEGKKRGGQKGGSKTSSITIQKVDSGETFYFGSKTECMNFLGWSSKKFSEFVKNKSDKKHTYKVLDPADS